MPRGSHRAIVVPIALAAALTMGAGAAGAATVRVDVTIEETLPTTTGYPVDGGIPGCDTPTTTTSDVRVREIGSYTRFAGTKTFTCDGGDDTIVADFAAWVRDGADRNTGYFVVTGGTGDFDGARGFGLLTGTYPDGDESTATSVLDRYRGVLGT
jgi:hypothetical protein